jgi:hypothetical protein
MSEHTSSKIEQELRIERLMSDLKSSCSDTVVPAHIRFRLEGASGAKLQERPTARQTIRLSSIALGAAVVTVMILEVISTVGWLPKQTVNLKSAQVSQGPVPLRQETQPIARVRSEDTSRVAVQPRRRVNPGPSVPQDTESQITIALPYSNADVSGEPSSTIRTVIRGSDLKTLGLQMPSDDPQAQVLAFLTLGGDGLPRSISVPVPLQAIQEKP